MGKNHGRNIYDASWEEMTKRKAFEGYMPDQVCISLRQTGGIMCQPIVVPGEYVERGQVIGEAEEEENLCVHASISGRVSEIRRKPYMPGIMEPYVCISRENEKEIEWHPFAVSVEKEKMASMIRRIGISKKRLPETKNLIVNGFANEPFITSGYRLIMESPGKIVIGSILGAIAAGAEKIYLCINSDAFDGIVRLKRAIKKYETVMGNRRPIKIVPMKHRYPDGNEKMICKDILSKKEGSRAVVSIAEMTALYDGIYDGEPWTKIGITVTGEVRFPKNLWVPIGTNVKEIIDHCGGMTENAIVVGGGPLDGQTMDPANAWVTRESEGLLVMNLKNIPMAACIHCGMCRDICPVGLKPDRIEKKYLMGKISDGEEKVSECIQCGLCSYVCPSGRRLTEYIGQVKKGRLRKTERKKTEGQTGSYIELPVYKKYCTKIKSLDQKSQSPPHIHRRGTIGDVMRHSIYAIFPLICACFAMYGGSRFHFLSMLFVGGASAWLAEYFWELGFKRYISVSDGSAVFTGILLALLFPVTTPLWQIGLAACAAVVLGKQIFGGIGSSVIHPVILGKFLISPFSRPMIEGLWAGAAIAFVWMLVFRMIPVLYPIIFLSILWVLQPWTITSASVYIAAAYFVWSYETMSVGKTGRFMRSVFAALFVWGFYYLGFGISSVFLSVGCMDILVYCMENGCMKRT